MINRNIIALGFVSFFTDMASSMVTSILPIFVVYILHDGIDKLGFIVGIATFVSYGFRFVFGYLSDRYKIVKPFVVGGYLISAITKPLLYFSSGWTSIATLRGIERVGKAIRSATKDTLISAYSQKGKSGKTFGFHKTMDIAGELSGSIIAFIALYYFGEKAGIFKDIFAFTLIPGIFAVIVVLFFVQDTPYSSKKSIQKIKLKDDISLLPVLLLCFGFVFFMFNDSFYLIKAKEAGYSLKHIPLLVIVLNLTQTLVSYFFGLKVDRFGAINVLCISFIFGIISMASLYFNLIIFSFIFLGLFMVSSVNALRAYISTYAKNKGSVYGLFYGGVAISGALGAIFTGLIWKHFGENGAISISLIALAILTLTFTFTQIYKKDYDIAR
ncbi:MAG: MFS transporter [Sulfurospirillum sp.]